jgi:hypothetical protein
MLILFLLVDLLGVVHTDYGFYPCSTLDECVNQIFNGLEERYNVWYIPYQRNQCATSKEYNNQRNNITMVSYDPYGKIHAINECNNHISCMEALCLASNSSQVELVRINPILN